MENAMSDLKPLLKPIEAARLLGVSVKLLRRCRENGLRFVLVTSSAIRYSVDDVQAYIQANTTSQRKIAKPTVDTKTTRRGVVSFDDHMKATGRQMKPFARKVR